jgi:hypothetical protein
MVLRVWFLHIVVRCYAYLNDNSLALPLTDAKFAKLQVADKLPIDPPSYSEIPQNEINRLIEQSNRDNY